MSGGDELKRLLEAMVGVYPSGPEARVELAALLAALETNRTYRDRRLERFQLEALSWCGRALAEIMVKASSTERWIPIPPESTLQALLGGSAYVLETRFIDGKDEEVPTLMPELAYFVSMPFLPEPEAQELSRQAGDLLAGWGER